MTRFGFLEFFLIEFVLYMLLWLSNDYLAALLSTLFGAISFFVTIVAWIAERLDPSRIPKWYFQLMIASVLAPLLAGMIYVWIMGGNIKF